MSNLKYKNIVITDQKAMEFHSDIISAVDMRLGRKPKTQDPIPMAILKNMINEYKKVLAQPSDHIKRYRVAKIASLVCLELPSIGLF